ncbi:WD repeat-containing protein 13-like isoform X2 [Xenia sp. Carnegie-2017]|uniref:WD repeat-containing protein 13-like isoform X2 n=1 Tax=Xenia sp. Carnegie-2017 TaxID=2897299 RepID=UPI001F049F11|nr:WD repeat-containing protein 13-like isoform X2 [Xenia sp. Carnegie-2017]
MNVCQQILALDAIFNTYRAQVNPQHRTLYIRRRTQLLREIANKDIDHSVRRQYLHVRKLILSKQHGPISDLQSLRSRSTSIPSRIGSVEQSFESVQGNDHGTPVKTHRRYQSNGSFQFLPPNVTMTMHEDLPLHGVVPTKKAEASRKMAGDKSLGENYAFAGMHHVFDQHAEAVTSIKFAHDEKHKLACSSSDGTLSICDLLPTPPSVTCFLRGHKAAIKDFDWSVANDFIVSASIDGTSRLWSPSSGQCLRVFSDAYLCPVLSCRFQPLNNNMIVTGNDKAHVQVYNTSTGKNVKGGTCRTTGAVLSLAFESTGTILWIGDEKGCILSFCFDIATGRLQKGKRIVVAYGCCITSISYRSWINREARDPSLLINVADNNLCLYRVTNEEGALSLKRSFQVRHERLGIRSSFCPLMSFRQGACVGGHR